MPHIRNSKHLFLEHTFTGILIFNKLLHSGHLVAPNYISFTNHKLHNIKVLYRNLWSVEFHCNIFKLKESSKERHIQLKCMFSLWLGVSTKANLFFKISNPYVLR